MLLDLLYDFQKFSCGPQAGTRLVALAGSGTAGCLLKKLGSGFTVSDALVAYAGLPSGTAYEYLLTNVAPPFLPILSDVGTARRKKRRKKLDEFEQYRHEQLLLRELIERAIDPLKFQKVPVVLAPDGKDVEVLAADGRAISIEVPELFSRIEVMRMVGQALQEAKVSAMRVKREQDADKALAIAKTELARISKRRRAEDEFLLLMD